MHTHALLLAGTHLLKRRLNILEPLLFHPFFPLSEETLQNGKAAWLTSMLKL